MVVPAKFEADNTMYRNAVAVALLAFLVGGCLPMPPMSTAYGAGPTPCGYHAVDNGMCPYVGYRQRPLPY
jgi:hypothetical protein